MEKLEKLLVVGGVAKATLDVVEEGQLVDLLHSSDLLAALGALAARLALLARPAGRTATTAAAAATSSSPAAARLRLRQKLRELVQQVGVVLEQNRNLEGGGQKRKKSACG